MADKTLKVTLNATDNASAVFKKAGDSAKKLGDELNNAGKGAQTFRQRFEEAARSVEDSNRQYDASNKIMRDVGISAGIMVAGMGLASQSFRDQQIALDTLSRTYGDSADEMERFAQQIQETTNFSNDAALEAANIAGTLARNYGFTAQEIQNVLQISADLAATSGLSLADTTQRVTAALRGEAEGAEVLGLTLNQAAIDSNNLTLTMSNQEAGHFRLNALIEQSGFAQGAAAQQADTFYGSLTNVRDGLQDLNQRLGGALGPLGDIGAFAADNAIQIGAMSLALGQLGKTAALINAVTASMTGLNVATTALSAGKTGILGLVTLLTGPVGLAAAFAATALAMEKFGKRDGDGKTMDEIWADTANGAAHLETVLSSLAASGAKDLYELGDAGSDILDSMYKDFERIDELTRIIDDSEGMDPAQLNAYKEELLSLMDTYGGVYEAVEDFSGAQNDLAMILANTGVGAGQARTELDELIGQWQRGEITAEVFIHDLGLIADNLGSYDVAATLAAESTEALTNGLLDVGGAIAALSVTDVAGFANDVFNFLRTGTEEGGKLESTTLKVGKAIADLALTDVTGFAESLVQGLHDGTLAAEEFHSVILEVGRAMSSDIADDVSTFAEAVYDALRGGDFDTAALDKLKNQYAEAFASMQTAATAVSDNLDTVFGAIVGNTNAIADSAQGVQDWADTLIGAAGTWGEIDQLLLDGAITLDDYTAAQGAYNDIAAANASIQQDVLSIQAQLAPVVATATEALAAQMDELANGSTDAQLFALGMMDATTSAQALALAQGYLENQEVFGPMIQQAAELNPMLAQILEEMGLISYNPATGEVRLLGVDESQSELALLTDAMDQLNQTVATLIAILQDDASGPIGDVQNLLDGLDGDTATVFANLIDSASSGIGAIAAQLYALDGFTATTYVQTLQTGLTGIFRHGGVAGYAHGGVIAELAEGNRTELLHFATGGVLPISQNGIYDIPVGTYVSPHNAVGDTGNHPSIVVNISGPFNNTDEAAMDRWAQQRLIPAFRGVLQDTRRGQVS